MTDFNEEAKYTVTGAQLNELEKLFERHGYLMGLTDGNEVADAYEPGSLIDELVRTSYQKGQLMAEIRIEGEINE